MIDTHCHLNFDAYAEDLDAVVSEAQDLHMTHIIIPGIDLESCQQVLDLSVRYAIVYGAVGIHPNSTQDFSATTLNAIRQYANHPKVVAIGEIGLDYYWDKSPRQTQLQAFEAQLELAGELDLPVIIHSRDAHADVLHILEQWVPGLPPAMRERPGVLHSFSAPHEFADRALALGFYLGFTGPITYRKADDLRSIAAQTPLERILVETDGPFLTPEPFRGKRNKPSYTSYMVDRLAALHNLSTERMDQITSANAMRLFRL
jgi:TatD DNase family protein